MSYQYQDNFNNAPLMVANTCNGISVSGSVFVAREDAPKIALEILKAAGHPPLETGGLHVNGTVGHLGYIAQELQDCIEINDKLTEAEERDERRVMLAAEFGLSIPENCYPDSALGRAIDRIIDLEKKGD